VKSTNYEASHYERVFALLLSSFRVQIVFLYTLNRCFSHKENKLHMHMNNKWSGSTVLFNFLLWLELWRQLWTIPYQEFPEFNLLLISEWALYLLFHQFSRVIPLYQSLIWQILWKLPYHPGPSCCHQWTEPCMIHNSVSEYGFLCLHPVGWRRVARMTENGIPNLDACHTRVSCVKILYCSV